MGRAGAGGWGILEPCRTNQLQWNIHLGVSVYEWGGGVIQNHVGLINYYGTCTWLLVCMRGGGLEPYRTNQLLWNLYLGFDMVYKGGGQIGLINYNGISI